MISTSLLLVLCAIAPALLMTSGALLFRTAPHHAEAIVWGRFRLFAATALAFTLAVPLLTTWLPVAGTAVAFDDSPWLALGPLTLWLAVLVQLLGTVIGVFSTRYLQGEPGQARYAAALSGVLAAVHLLLLADHWLVLIAAWAAVGLALQPLLYFYPDRPFARLAAHKKRIADRVADGFLLAAAALAWSEVGSGSLSALWAHLDQHGASVALQASALCVALAVILRTALFPVHGWLIQVMEAPTPVSALLHAGVVNLGGFVLIRFAPLLEATEPARWLLVVCGLGTAVLAGMVMLTRISIKVRLAWSTVAQMGFMVLECGLGLYSLAVLHLIGHSLYKAHAFLSASSVVRESRLQMLRGQAAAAPSSLLLAPALSLGVVMLVQAVGVAGAWPWWWNGVLALAWAPLLWLPARRAHEPSAAGVRALAGLALVAGLTLVSALAHLLPLGVSDAPATTAGYLALAGVAALYLALVMLQWQSQRLAAWRRWSYAGFYVDEFYTRFALRVWPAGWSPAATRVPAAGSRDKPSMITPE